jgi:ABC-type polysaccharide/polyol phosphate transport system ATPase subunit
LAVTASPNSVERAAVLARAPVAVSVQDVSKTFKLPHHEFSTLKERVLHPFRSRGYESLHALRGVSFEVRQGEFFGVVGRNGSGKSTLLKCLAGIYAIDSGAIGIDGRLSPFIELGVGFNPDLTARDNVLINAIMLGLSRKQARERFDSIIEFAELQEFVDLPLKNYSSGMHVRLAFAVAVEVDAEILLVDEVLAVGDAAFQQKCFDQFNRMKDEGRTIMFVTHDMSAVERFCDRAILIERGRLIAEDEPETIARKYNEVNFGRIDNAEGDDTERFGDHRAAEITRAWFEDGSGEPVSALPQGDTAVACFEVRFHEATGNPIFEIGIRNEFGALVFATSSLYDNQRPTGVFDAGEQAIVRVSFENVLAPSRYLLSPSVRPSGSPDDLLDQREDLATVIVHSNRLSGGVVDLHREFDVERR